MSSAESNIQAGSPLSGALVLVGVAGGIAAYKGVEVVSRLVKEEAETHVLMTSAATRFVTPLTFEAMAGQPVITSVFPGGPVTAPKQAYPHLYPATSADIFLVAPATADVISRLAHGMGDDAVTTAALSLPADCRRYFAPAMNVEMWHQPVVQDNVRRLEALGWQRIGPEAGLLACGMTGEGRMSEPAEIVAILRAGRVDPVLAGRKVLVLSGPTREYLDPVRFISNASSGKMGGAIAREAHCMGADVTLITGPVGEANLPRQSGITVIAISSAAEMLAAAERAYDEADAVVFAAAVADYRPATCAGEKQAKQSDGLTLPLVPNPDIAATLNRRKRPGQVAIGFALQTHDGEARALEKLAAKNLDAIVLNAPDALGGDSGAYAFYRADAGATGESWGHLQKRECARRLLTAAATIMGGGTTARGR